MRPSIKRFIVATAQLPLLPFLAVYVALSSLRRIGRRPAPPRPKKIALVVPCDAGIKSGTERAIRDMQEMLALDFELNIIPLHKLNPAPGRITKFVTDWIVSAIQLGDHTSRYMGDGSPVVSRIGDGDVVVIEFVQSSTFLFRGARLNKPIVIRDHEVLARRFAKELAAASGLTEKFALSVKLASAWLLTFHLYLIADRIVALTPEDAAWIRRWFPFIGDRVLAIPVSFAVDSQEPKHSAVTARDLIYAANFYHQPNVDGLLWFLSGCASNMDSNVTLHLVGIDDPLSKIQLPSSGLNIVRHGHVADIESHPVLSGVCIALAPIISGGGIRVKNLLFGSYGKAIVTTPLGNEGVQFRHGEEAMICETPREFADAVNRLIRDPELAIRIGRNARSAVQSRFSHEAILAQYRSALFSSRGDK